MGLMACGGVGPAACGGVGPAAGGGVGSVAGGVGSAASGRGLGAQGSATTDVAPAAAVGRFVAGVALRDAAAPVSSGVPLLAGPVEPVAEPAVAPAAPFQAAGPVAEARSDAEPASGAEPGVAAGPAAREAPLAGAPDAASVVDGVGRASSTVGPGASDAGGSAGGGQLGWPGAQPEAVPEGPLTPQPPGAGTAPVSDG
ncbi:hypothetical protein [Micromonospora sp. CV4]|uniref:hypothetical protein n=1 Tax=Micromonospora sp. CV4 TaxID=2478711 RepID=UPI0011C400FC|nr:hypothetical protein [Micromonospora sp. CV4]